MVKLGKYKHFKGGLYRVLFNALNTETMEAEIIYQPLQGDGKTWVRSEKMWNEKVVVDGKKVGRFVYLGDENEETVETLLCNDEVRLEKVFSNGVPSPDGFWYCQDEKEWVSLISGEAEIEFENEIVKLATNGQMCIPAYKKHRVKTVSADAVWLCLYF